MDIYKILVFFILINGFVSYAYNNKRYKKYFIVSTFLAIILIAALRGSDIGRDLEGHYASNFVLIANTDWDSLIRFTTTGMYDIGFVIFCKLISYISQGVQCFIIATSLITFGSIGRYIYKHSEDVILETFLLVTSFLMFMYMSMIAQVLAIAIMLYAVDYLNEKKYIKFVLLVILASTLHSSAIICLIFIPLSLLEAKRNYIFGFIILLTAVMVGFDRLLSFAITYIFPQYSFYFLEGALHNAKEQIGGSNLTQLLIYVSCATIGILSLFIFNSSTRKQELMLKKYSEENIRWLNSGFLVYLSLSAIVFRIMLTYGSVIKRVGYYFYPFAFTLLCRGLGRFDPKVRFTLKLIIYVAFLYFFLTSEQRLGEIAYGVFPYEFFWK